MGKAREIKVYGTGKIMVKPDFVTVKIELSKTDMNYAKGYDAFNRDMKDLQKGIESMGFSREDLKASSIYSSEKTEYEKNKNVFKGYKFTANLEVSFDLDVDRLGKIVTGLSALSIKPTYRIRFKVKDSEGIESRLLAITGQNARRKAEILCESLGVKLGKIIDVNYNWKDMDINSKMTYAMATDDYVPQFHRRLTQEPIEFTPQDIEITDDAYFVWEIEE